MVLMFMMCRWSSKSKLGERQLGFNCFNMFRLVKKAQKSCKGLTDIFGLQLTLDPLILKVVPPLYEIFMFILIYIYIYAVYLSI